MIASGSFPNCDFETHSYGREVLHRIKIKGRFSLKERILLYQETLKHNSSSSYFCIIDNSDKHENVLGYDDIIYIDNLILKAGINRFYGVTITQDNEYSRIVSLANEYADISNIAGKMFATDTPQEAEDFIFSKIKSPDASK